MPAVAVGKKHETAPRSVDIVVRVKVPLHLIVA